MKQSHVPSVLTSAALVVALAGCGGPGSATPSPTAKPTTSTTPTASASPTPTPEAEPAEATLILVLPHVIGVRGDAGDPPLADYDYFTPIGTITSGLTGFFGFEPIVTHVEADPNGDGVSYTNYYWEGFALRDWDRPASVDAYTPEFQLYVDVGDVRGISIETAGNSKVGDATDAVAAANSDVQSYSGEGGVGYTTIRVFPMDPVNGRYGPISLAVRLDGRTGGVIDFMLSPWPDQQM